MLIGRGVRLTSIGRRKDLDAVAYLTHALHAGGNFLSNLLEIVGGKAAPQMDDVAAYVASDVAKREVTAVSNSLLGLAADQRPGGTD